jgi:hypothetical protein
MRTDDAVRPNAQVFIDNRVRPDADRWIQLGFGVKNSGGMDHSWARLTTRE